MDRPQGGPEGRLVRGGRHRRPPGRLASNVAKILKGKHKPTYTPHLNTGDHVIVINASRVLVTGSKLDDKVYTRYSGYPSGLR